MDFFANQDTARRHTTLLVFYFLLAVLGIVVAVNAVSAIAFKAVAAKAANGEAAAIPGVLYLLVTIVTLAIIGIGSLVQIIGMASGGAAVARMMGARPVSGRSRDANERRLLNVVEEMAIASGVSVPQVFVMADQRSINAFAAGFSPNQAAVVVTRGTLEALNRDELQGVIGHEFSHILNGDMRLNMRLMGVLGGILVLATLGRMVADVSAQGDSKAWPLVMLGLGLVAIGYIGVFFGRVIQASVSRQREFLADASSVQFTRNPDGIGGALAKIGLSSTGARIDHPRTAEASHMFFGEAIESGFFRSHVDAPAHRRAPAACLRQAGRDQRHRRAFDAAGADAAGRGGERLCRRHRVRPQRESSPDRSGGEDDGCHRGRNGCYGRGHVLDAARGLCGLPARHPAATGA